METVLRAVAIYFALLLILRATGKRSLAQMTTFDFVLLLILGEATQQALVGEDFSLTTGILLIATLMGIDAGLAWLQRCSPGLQRLVQGMPLILMEDGELHRDRLAKTRIDESEILEAARSAHGLERLEQIRHAVLEVDGEITILPRR